MKTRDILILLVSFSIGVALLTGAGLQLEHINAQRKDMKLVINEPLENAPPSLAFATVAMGAFRGLMVDILWMRADNLKEEGKFFDAKQLAEWITVLQPRFSAVWEFHAWNMAYNISVAIPATRPHERWRWVKNGYELIRDKGIYYNPRSLPLYREMGRIFQHKMGGISDDAHKHYKIQFAREIYPVVGRANKHFFEDAIKAPDLWEEIMTDPNVASFVSDMRSADPNFGEDEAFIKSYFSFQTNPARFNADANDVLSQYKDSEVFLRFVAFAHKYELRHTWKLDVDLMHELNKTLGPVDFDDPNNVIPLDWRHPDTHAVYWGYKALKLAAQDEDRVMNTDELNNDRIVAHSLQNLFRYGKMYFMDVPIWPTQPDGSRAEEPVMITDLFLRPDLRMFDRYNNILLDVLAKYKDDRGRRESLGNGHRNFLKNAILSFYQAGDKQQALRIFRQVGKQYPRPEFKTSLADFCRKRFLEEIETSLGIHDAREQVVQLLRESHRFYAMGADDEAYGNISLATEIREHYMKEFGDEETRRIDLPEMKHLLYVAACDLLEDPRSPDYLKANFLARMSNERPDVYKSFQHYEQQQKKDEGTN
jgi:hypothetical protein